MNERYVPGPESPVRRPVVAPVRRPAALRDAGGTYIEKALAILILAILLIGCFVVLRPFIAAILWATILSYATWPAFMRLQQALHGRRGLAAAILTLAIGALLLTPVILLGVSLAENVVRLIEAVRH